MRRRMVLVPVVFVAVALSACGGGDSDDPEAQGGARLSVAYPSEALPQTLTRIYGDALEKAGVTVSYAEPDPGGLFAALSRGQASFAVVIGNTIATTSGVTRLEPSAAHLEDAPSSNVVPVIRTEKLTPALRAAIDRVSKALSSEELVELQEQTDPAEEGHISPEAAADRWLGLNGF